MFCISSIRQTVCSACVIVVVGQVWTLTLFGVRGQCWTLTLCVYCVWSWLDTDAILCAWSVLDTDAVCVLCVVMVWHWRCACVVVGYGWTLTLCVLWMVMRAGHWLCMCVMFGQEWTRQNRTSKTRTRWSDWTLVTPSLWTSFTQTEPASSAQTWVTSFHLINIVVRSFNGRSTEFKYRNSIVDFL